MRPAPARRAGGAIPTPLPPASRTMVPAAAPRLLLAAILSAGVAAGPAACTEGARSAAPRVEGGDVDRGKDLIAEYACGSCHIIPGIIGADATAGPPLTDWVERRYIAGALYNTPENLVAWLLDPPAIEPGTAMPDVGMSEREARDVAAYLFTIGDPTPSGPPHPFPVEWLEDLHR